MFALTNNPEMGARLYAGLIRLATDPAKGTDIMQLIQHIAGVLVETYLVFDSPDESMMCSLDQLSTMLGVEPLNCPVALSALPPAHIMDRETEKGREAARELFEEWMDCAYEFHNLMITIIHNVIVSWEEHGQNRAESLRLLIECVHSCMRNEIAAGELCDIVIERTVAMRRWSLAECVAGLSAVAGYRLAESLDEDEHGVFKGADLPIMLDNVAHVMTQEAVRLGVPAGSNWRFGLAANDIPVTAPYDLIGAMLPYCNGFFKAINCRDKYAQAVACAKAAGRMLAVAAGGDFPEMEPVIAKPLAMAAMSDTYKSVCRTQNIATC